MIEHIDDFRAQEEPQQIVIPGLPPMQRDGVFNRYKVNVIVTHATDATAPAVFEESPSYYHMFGRIDYRSTFGSMMTDHTRDALSKCIDKEGFGWLYLVLD